jgi:beta-glucosidase
MQKLGVNAYRFSIAWPQVLPAGRGDTNEAGLAFYDRLVDGLLDAGIEPWICLYHWSLPQAMQDQGGWLNRDIAGWYADYAALIAKRFGDHVRKDIA